MLALVAGEARATGSSGSRARIRARAGGGGAGVRAGRHGMQAPSTAMPTPTLRTSTTAMRRLMRGESGRLGAPPRRASGRSRSGRAGASSLITAAPRATRGGAHAAAGGSARSQGVPPRPSR
eukprot:13604103-Alexandrium_andersonii.AAC.1